MSSFFGGGIFIFIFALPVLIAQWIGVVKLSKLGRPGEWWCMLTGTILASLSPILQILGIFLMGMSSGGSAMSIGVVFAVIGAVTALGSLLFAIGFAIHATKQSSLRDRISELEMITLAQSTELQQRQGH